MKCSECGLCWADRPGDIPYCHFDGFGKAPCEEDDWDDTEYEEEEVENGKGFFYDVEEDDPFHEKDPM